MSKDQYWVICVQTFWSFSQTFLATLNRRFLRAKKALKLKWRYFPDFEDSKKHVGKINIKTFWAHLPQKHVLPFK
jgi:hypothetical protein